ncbi:MAG: serine/threonine protein kinase [Polyangiaceae bacterium]|nr:serine/threonine protein kinase [Polyangiaceae bacterium]
MSVRSAASRPAVAPVMAAGTQLGRYELLMPIATGGMAMVWAARMQGTRGFQKVVAVKTMLPKMSEDPDFERMFLAEASLASKIRHPHVVEIFDLGDEDGVLYLVMEWIEGAPLSDLLRVALRKGGVPLPVAVRIVMQACAGLHAAHELRDDDGQLIGLVHRDVSPQNILVSVEGVTKVVDFGVAKATALGGATGSGSVKGKIAYMAPEQVKGGDIDRRVDVFAIGTVLYALTTGRHPFRGENDSHTLMNILSEGPPRAPSELVASFPKSLERVILQALAKDPAKRFPTANELLKALDRALPPPMRLSSDEDVALFVRSVLGDELDARRATLREALEAAPAPVTGDQRSLRKLLESQPPPPPEGASGPSWSAVSEGERSGSGSGASQSSLSVEAAGAASADVAASAPRRRRATIGVAVGVGALGLVGAIAWLRPPGEPVVAASAAALPVAPSAGPAIEAVAPAPPPVPAASDPAPEASAVAPSGAASAQRTAPGAPRPGGGAARPAAGTPPRPGNWRTDPGF